MTGPEHYKAADEILAAVKNADPDAPREDLTALLAIAAVHASLATAAAIAGLDLRNARHVALRVLADDSVQAWRDAGAVGGAA